MEQKQLDEIEDSFFGEEIIEDDYIDISKTKVKEAVELKEKKPSFAPNPKKGRPLKSSVKEIDEEFPEAKEPEIQIRPAKDAKPAPKVDFRPEPPKIATASPADPWKNEQKSSDNSGKGSSFWKIVTLLLIIALAVSVWTKGFDFGSQSGLTLKEAEERAIQYVNSKLLQPPFVAEITKSEDTGNLYKITFSVAGQTVDSYLSKDGKLFFPQALEIKDADLLGKDAVFDVSADDDAVKGQANAPVTIIEFSDFQCPYCAKFFKETLPLLEKEYIQTGKAKFIFRDFPLDFHQYAQKAAEAAECAGDQGKYWELHSMLYLYQNKLDPESLKVYANELGIDMTKFNKCLDTGEMAEEVKKDFADGQKYGLTGTPAFFINGKLVTGAVPYADFKKEIEAALGKAAGTVPETKAEEKPKQEEKPAEPKAGVPAGSQTEPGTEPKPEPKAEIPVPEEKPAQTEFTVQAKKWMFDPNKITLKKGTKIKLTIVPSDLKFTFSAPDFGVEKEIAETTTFELNADKAGTFNFKCGSCEDWRGMAGKIVVE